jgi:hypothetical protein
MEDVAGHTGGDFRSWLAALGVYDNS